MIPRIAARHNPAMPDRAAVRAGFPHHRDQETMSDRYAGYTSLQLEHPSEMHRDLAGIRTEIDRDPEARAGDNHAMASACSARPRPRLPHARLLQAVIIWLLLCGWRPPTVATCANIRSSANARRTPMGIDDDFAIP
jgi:hypothetical protein